MNEAYGSLQFLVSAVKSIVETSSHNFPKTDYNFPQKTIENEPMSIAAIVIETQRERTITDHGAGERNCDCRRQTEIKDETQVVDGQRRHYDNRITVAEALEESGNGGGARKFQISQCVLRGPETRDKRNDGTRPAKATHLRRQR